MAGMKSILWGLAACALAVPAVAEDTVVLLWHQRPPYIFKQDDRLHGVLAERTAAAFAAAGVPVAWEETPAARELAEIKDDTRPACAIGWFRMPEREQFALFPRTPLYQDRPTVVLARADDTRVTEHHDIRDLLADRRLILLVKGGYSYTASVDTLVAETRPRTATTTGDNLTIVRMLAGQRADYTFVAPEEGGYLLAAAPSGSALAMVPGIAGMPEGAKRYLMCSKTVGTAVMDRLDAALRKTP
jgi:uncharacterized protein (TIGR02285 family)